MQQRPQKTLVSGLWILCAVRLSLGKWRRAALWHCDDREKAAETSSVYSSCLEAMLAESLHVMHKTLIDQDCNILLFSQDAFETVSRAGLAGPHLQAELSPQPDQQISHLPHATPTADSFSFSVPVCAAATVSSPPPMNLPALSRLVDPCRLLQVIG